jgi:hypothetical protein
MATTDYWWPLADADGLASPAVVFFRNSNEWGYSPLDSTMAAPQTFCIQELCDNIASYIVLNSNYRDILQEGTVYDVDAAVILASQDTLKSTALVCHTLRMSAQSQLFQHIILNPQEFPGFMNVDAKTALDGAISALGRLSAITAASPHLLRLIRSVSVLAQSAVLEPLWSIQIPLLRRICLDFGDTQRQDRLALEFVRNTISLPSIREVELFGPNHALNLDDIASLFETCTGQLCSLSFHGIYFIDSGIYASPPSTICLSRSRPRRCQIQTLRIDNADQLADWLISPCCPFDFSRLLNLEVRTPNGPSAHFHNLHKLLASTRLTQLKRLEVFGGELSASNLCYPYLLYPQDSHHRSICQSFLPCPTLKRIFARISHFPPLSCQRIDSKSSPWTSEPSYSTKRASPTWNPTPIRVPKWTPSSSMPPCPPSGEWRSGFAASVIIHHGFT